MLFREVMTIYCENHKKHKNTSTLLGQNAEFWYAKTGGIYSKHWDLKSYLTTYIFMYMYITQ
jgi:hypothetical protein